MIWLVAVCVVVGAFCAGFLLPPVGGYIALGVGGLVLLLSSLLIRAASRAHGSGAIGAGFLGVFGLLFSVPLVIGAVLGFLTR